MSQEFPDVQGGGSLILAWQIRNKKVLVVGGGEVIPFLPSRLSMTLFVDLFSRWQQDVFSMS